MIKVSIVQSQRKQGQFCLAFCKILKKEFNPLFYPEMTKVETEDGQLIYTKYEGGNRSLLVFHGFGQDKTIFKEWSIVLREQYTLYSFDLFYHGESKRPHGKLSKKEWNEYLQVFLRQENIKAFSVLGFSLGGRFAIATSLLHPTCIEELILIAPDGIFLSIWFKLATNPSIKWLFKYLMFNPDKLEKLIALNRKYKVVSPYIGHFVEKEMGDEENRKRVYLSWNSFKTLGFKKSDLINQFGYHNFRKRLILGKEDHVIKPSKILPLTDKMGFSRVDILNYKHHQLIKPEVAKLILDET